MVTSYKATDDGRLQMIRVERHEEVRPGISRYTVPGFARRSATARACFRAPMARRFRDILRRIRGGSRR